MIFPCARSRWSSRSGGLPAVIRGGPAAPRAAVRRRRVGRKKAQKAQKPEDGRRILSQRPQSADTEAEGDGRRIGRRAEGGGRPTEHTEHTEHSEGFEQEKTERTEDGGGGEGFFTGGNGENGGCFFIRAIRVIRGEKVWNVGRKKAQEAQKSEGGGRTADDGGRSFVTEATERGHRGSRRRRRRKDGGKDGFYRREQRERSLIFYPRYPRDPR